MKRHPALVPLSHDHHHGLAQALRLRRAGESRDQAQCDEQARAFLRFYNDATLRHFREEEELLFPLAFVESSEPPDLLVRAVVDHIRIHALVARLAAAAGAGAVNPDLLATLGHELEAHIRLEERELFPLIEQISTDEQLDSLPIEPRA